MRKTPRNGRERTSHLLGESRTETYAMPIGLRSAWEKDMSLKPTCLGLLSRSIALYSFARGSLPWWEEDSSARMASSFRKTKLNLSSQIMSWEALKLKTNFLIRVSSQFVVPWSARSWSLLCKLSNGLAVQWYGEPANNISSCIAWSRKTSTVAWNVSSKFLCCQYLELTWTFKVNRNKLISFQRFFMAVANALTTSAVSVVNSEDLSRILTSIQKERIHALPAGRLQRRSAATRGNSTNMSWMAAS